MSVDTSSKPIPRSVLVFGAAGHIGGPLARYLRHEAPHIQLRLVSSRPEGIDDLRRAHPYAEAVVANYFDLASLESAVEGMEGVFVITPPRMDEGPAMTNLVAALKKADSAVHILRTLGLQPLADERRIPQALRDAEFVLPIQHPIAKRILDESDLPVTYLNLGATFMDNFLKMKEGLKHERKLIWHDRLVPFIDPREIAEVGARLFLSQDRRHIGQAHLLNNGHDLMRFSEAVELMSDVLGEKITHDASREAFFAAYSQRLGARCSELWEFLEYEKTYEVAWSRNDFVERTLGRKPLTLRDWLLEHAERLLD
ncbi:NAD(P)H-binding protein [Streptomyces justiciae]|uniref:NAD(P)H-binding protein n=1 Tax=Streptomyces justiciae TaxID=2780140 RepID=UPI00211772C0|nr:NAD(P)H-binding protein [Streptomyces justiciae]MCW8378657.1 NAD(P)H-binding protein [Streptomyces justiciae]